MTRREAIGATTHYATPDPDWRPPRSPQRIAAETAQRAAVAKANNAKGPAITNADVLNAWTHYEAANTRANAAYNYRNHTARAPGAGCRDCGTDELVADRRRCKDCQKTWSAVVRAARKATA